MDRYCRVKCRMNVEYSLCGCHSHIHSFQPITFLHFIVKERWNNVDTLFLFSVNMTHKLSCKGDTSAFVQCKHEAIITRFNSWLN